MASGTFGTGLPAQPAMTEVVPHSGKAAPRRTYRTHNLSTGRVASLRRGRGSDLRQGRPSRRGFPLCRCPRLGNAYWGCLTTILGSCGESSDPCVPAPCSSSHGGHRGRHPALRRDAHRSPASRMRATHPRCHVSPHGSARQPLCSSWALLPQVRLALAHAKPYQSLMRMFHLRRASPI